MSSSSNQNSVTVESIAEEFLARQRQGEQPSIEEYALRYPELAEEIHDVLSALQFIEEFKQPASRNDVASSPPEETYQTPVPQFADYRIERIIGRGGMGVVYEAIQVSLNRQVALKVLPQDFAAHRNALARFQQEARAAATLHHTNIVPVYEVGFEGGYHFYSMQYIDGQGLDTLINEIALSRNAKSNDASINRFKARQRAKERDSKDDSTTGQRRDDATRLDVLDSRDSIERPSAIDDTRAFLDDTDRDSLDDHEFEIRAQMDRRPLVRRLESQGDQFKVIARIGMQAANALAHANEQGIIHRDIKPANMLMDQNCNVWIADFGLAKFDEENLTRTGDIVGTLRYMAPERFRGECDARSDIYSLGMSLYELIALRPAYDANNRLSLLDQIREHNPPRLRTIDGKAPRDLVTIINKSIEKEPSRRYQSAVDFAKDLSRFIGNRPIHARRIGLVERMLRWSRKNPSLATALLIIVLLTVSGIAALSIGLEYFRQQEAQQRILAETNRQHLYDAEMKLAFDELNSKNGIQLVREILHRWVPGEDENDLRGWEWYYLDNACRQETNVIETKAQMFRAQLSPSGRYLATLSGVLDIIDLETFEIVTTLLEDERAIFSDLNWLSDDEIWVLKEGKEILCFDLEKDRQAKTIRLPVFTLRFAIDPDQSLMVLHDRDKQHVLCNADDGKLIKVLETNSMGSLKQPGMAFDSTGSWFASANEDHTISIYKVGSWNHRYSIPTENQNLIETIAWAPHQQKLAATDWGGRVSIVEFNDVNTQSKLIANQDAPVLVLAWNQTGTKLAFGCNDHLLRIWNESQQSVTKELYGHYGAICGVHFVGGEHSLLSVSKDTTVRTWQIDRPEAFLERQFTTQGNENVRVGWNADDEFYTCGHLDHDDESSCQIWDRFGAPTNRVLRYNIVRWRKGHNEFIGYRNGKLAWCRATDQTEFSSVSCPSLHQSSTDYCARAHRLVFSTVDSSQNNGIYSWQPHLDTAPQKLIDSDYHPVVRVSPDGSMIATGAKGAPGVFDAESGELIKRFDDIQGIKAAAWSHDGDQLALSGNDGTIQLYRTGNWKHTSSFTGHSRHLRDMEFHPSQNRLASVGDDTFLRIWNTETERLVIAIEHDSSVVDVVWHSSGKSLATATKQGFFRIWHAAD